MKNAVSCWPGRPSPAQPNHNSESNVDHASFIDSLNSADEASFVAQLGHIFEHSPWIPGRAWARRPFASLGELHGAMLDVLEHASHAEQLALICAHPELAGKEADAGSLTDDSTQEQRGAGLDNCSAAEKEHLVECNRAYRERFGFPFVIAVKGLTRYDIITAMEKRLQGDPEVEFRECLVQIGRIAGFRLAALETA